MKYNPKLDTLRALAALGVLSAHYTSWMDWGWIGVPFFFVLSGYLIMSIILESKQSNVSFAQFIGNFFRRRALRLFPAYFLFLTILCICEIAAHQTRVARDVPYFLTYTFNYRMIDMVGRGYAHLWTLSVEWQFYLFLPFAVWLLNEKTLRRVLLGLVCLAPLLRLLSVRWFTHLHGGSDSDTACHITYLMTWTHVDTLALGCLLAWSDWRAWFRSRSVRRAAAGVVIVGGAAVVALGFWDGYWTPSTAFGTLGYEIFLPHFKEYVWGYSVLAILFATIIAACADSPKETNWIFRSEWLRYLGKVSYGFYIYHLPVVTAVSAVLKLEEAKDRALFSHGWEWQTVANVTGFALSIAITFAFAHYSYQYVERRFLRLEKRRIPLAITP